MDNSKIVLQGLNCLVLQTVLGSILPLPSLCCYLDDMTGESVALVIGHNLLPDELVHDVGKVGQEEGQHLK